MAAVSHGSGWTDADTDAYADDTPDAASVLLGCRLCLPARGGALMTTTQIADAQLMCITFAKLAAHNGQRTLAMRLVQIATELDWELHVAAEDSREKDGE